MSNNDLPCPKCNSQHHPTECLKEEGMTRISEVEGIIKEHFIWKQFEITRIDFDAHKQATSLAKAIVQSEREMLEGLRKEMIDARLPYTLFYHRVDALISSMEDDGESSYVGGTF